jgi:hypothetical protein
MRQARIKKTFLRVQRYNFDRYKQIYSSILFLNNNLGLIKIQKNIGIVDGVKNFFLDLHLIVK